jgi:hypothetical protein
MKPAATVAISSVLALGSLTALVVAKLLLPLAPPAESKGFSAQGTGSALRGQTTRLVGDPDAGASARGNVQTTKGASAIAPVAGTSDPLRARLEALTEHEAKQFYLDCSDAALHGTHVRASTTACSVSYDVLLSRHFGGDFHALLAWSRSQRHESAEAAANSGD